MLQALCLLSNSTGAGATGAGENRVAYSFQDLLELRPAVNTEPWPLIDLPPELKPRKRGKKGGARQRLKQRGFKPFLPAIIMGNLQSIAKKMDEFSAIARMQKDYRECSLLCCTETWSKEVTPDSAVSLDGFTLVRADRDTIKSGKTKGGGVSIYANKQWCHPGHITVKEKICTPHIELLAVSIRPYYLPREFSHVLCLTVYIPPEADNKEAAETIHTVTAELLTKSPNAFMAISGDFNQCSLSTALPNFTQYVKCPTRGNKTLDKLYANVKDAYNSKALPPIGLSDHNMVHLVPKYKPIIMQQPVSTRTVREWTPDVTEALQDCFESTDWDMFCEAYGDNCSELTECITDYIHF